MRIDARLMADVAKDQPLDPESPEAKNIEKAVLQITSPTLAQLARSFLRKRYEMHPSAA